MKPNAFCRFHLTTAGIACGLFAIHSSVRAATATWNNIAPDFNTGGNWTGGTGAGGIPGSGDNATFSSAVTHQPDLSGSLQIQGLTFSTATGGWTLASANNSVLTLTNTGTTTSSAINASNTSGTNAISTNLVLGGAAATTATFTQARGGTLNLSGNISSTNAITGLSLSGAGTGTSTFTLSGNNTYAGNTTFNAGNIALNINSATAIGSGTLVFTNSATIDNTSATSSLVLTNSNNINLSGGSLTYTGTGGNSLSFGSGLVTVSGANRTVTVSGGTLSIGSIAADNATRTFTKSGAGSLVIANAANSSFQGGFIFNGANGVVLVGNKASLGSGNITATTGVLQASTDLSGVSNKLANTMTLSALTVSGSNNIEIGGKLTGTTAGNRTLTSSITGGNLLTLNDVDINPDTAASRSLTIAGSGNTSVVGIVANGNGTTANTLSITNTGTTTLANGGNTFSGGATLNSASGTLALGADSSPSGVGSTVTNGPLGTGTFTFQTGTLTASGGARTIANPITFVNANNYAIGGGNDLTLNGAVSWNGTQTLTVNNSGITTFGGQFTLRNDNTIAQRTLTLAGTGTVQMNGAIVNGSSLNGIVVHSGTGTTVLNGNNSYSGTTTIATDRTVRLGHANGLGFGGAATNNVAGSTTVSAGGTLDLNGQVDINEAITIDGNGVGGNGALINSNTGTTAVIGSGVASLTLTNNGSGYSTAPSVTINNGGGATANALLGISIATIGLSANGSTYTTAPTITISGGGGTGAAASVDKATGVVTITSLGSGYTSVPTVVLTGGTGLAGPGFTVSPTGNNFIVSALQTTAAGSGASNPTVTFGSGTAVAAANATSVGLAGTTNNRIGGAGDIIINGIVTGGATSPLNKVGNGKLTLNATNTYVGATAVNAGKLVVGSTGSINNSSAITVSAGSKLIYNSSTSLTVGTTLNGAGTGSRAVLGGTGTINTALALDNLGDTLSPGNSPGIQTFTPNQSWNSFSYDWEVNNFAGSVAGTDYDQIGITGALSLTGGSGSYILNLLSLTGSNIAGNVGGFSDVDRSWTILTSSGLTGFDAANWTVNSGDFTTSPAYTGNFSLGQVGNDLVLTYTVVPEPAAALLGSLGLLTLLLRRRQD